MARVGSGASTCKPGPGPNEMFLDEILERLGNASKMSCRPATEPAKLVGVRPRIARKQFGSSLTFFAIFGAAWHELEDLLEDSLRRSLNPGPGKSEKMMEKLTVRFRHPRLVIHDRYKKRAPLPRLWLWVGFHFTAASRRGGLCSCLCPCPRGRRS